ncbi:DNA-binding transcriptional LysR family regulator [Peteryoungia aggregata LMG 23059]|uniref:DNA-binding transcriptional LysR family regulator n=1 Tax=Peteryoungia aggregata LMG 23059 TaxID=1368425 RepID=A0ABU0G720_9HYPH|nr:LysR substrate-binding domain-containing protein [Peteryoungia aggregata]MDQ0420744.1 DNA-binding transcriptional LysR family regulator [Peteryoungia aggregata LMG 23059]
MPSAIPPLRLLTVFDAVNRCGSTRGAARELNVTQPAISQAIRALEEHIGVTLYDRGTRPVSLTSAGEIMRAGVSQGLSRIAEAIERAQAEHGTDENSVTIGCTVGTATYWLMPRLAGFYADHPQVAVNVLTTIDSPNVTHGVDMVIRYGLGAWEDGDVTKLFDERLAPVFSPALHDPPRSLSDLRHATLLHVVKTDPTWLSWKDYFERLGLPENRLRGRNFSNYVQATQAALSQQGVMLGWHSNTGDLIREGRLVALEGGEYVPREAFYLVVPARSREREACRLFANWILRLR